MGKNFLFILRCGKGWSHCHETVGVGVRNKARHNGQHLIFPWLHHEWYRESYGQEKPLLNQKLYPLVPLDDVTAPFWSSLAHL